MPNLQRRERRKPKEAILLSFSILIVLVGLWLLYNNISSFSKGFFAGEKIETEGVSAVPKISPVIPKSS